MRLIAHRGNTEGPNPQRENHPIYLLDTLDKGYDIEVDVWRGPTGKLWLGHDEPKYPVDVSWLANERVWVHAKDVDTFLTIGKYKKINSFFQKDDEVALTTHGYFWLHSNCSVLSSSSILTRLDYSPGLVNHSALGICSDYVSLYRKEYKQDDNYPFRLLIIDIDGVMTNGSKTYDRNGCILSKEYKDIDFTAIKRFQAAGIKVCFLSGDKAVNEEMAKSRGVPFHYARGTNGSIDKSEFITQFQQIYSVPLDKMAYIGDDYYDLSIINNLNHTSCPANSIQDIKDSVKLILNTKSGEGCIAELYEYYRKFIRESYPVDSLEINPK